MQWRHYSQAKACFLLRSRAFHTVYCQSAHVRGTKVQDVRPILDALTEADDWQTKLVNYGQIDDRLRIVVRDMIRHMIDTSEIEEIGNGLQWVARPLLPVSASVADDDGTRPTAIARATTTAEQVSNRTQDRRVEEGVPQALVAYEPTPRREAATVLDDPTLLEILSRLQTACSTLARNQAVESERTEADLLLLNEDIRSVQRAVPRLTAENEALSKAAPNRIDLDVVRELEKENSMLRSDVATLARRVENLERRRDS